MSISRLIKILVVVFVALASTSITFTLLADRANTRREDALNQRIQLIQAVNDLQTASTDLTRWARTYAVTGNIQEYNEFMNEIENVQRRENAVLAFEAFGAPQAELTMIQNALALDESLAALDDLAFDAVKAGNMGLAMEITFGAEYESLKSQIFATLTQLSSIVEVRTNIEYNIAHDSSALFQVLVLVVTITFALLSIAAIVLIYWKISPIHKLTTILSEVASGNLNVNINRDNISNDEIGMLKRDVFNLVDAIKSIIQDLNLVRKEYLEVGNMHHVIDSSQYQNSFKEMVESVNFLLNSITRDIEEVADVLDHISGGDFTRDLDETVWIGEWAIVPKAVNKLTDNLRSVDSEIGSMIEAAAERGDLHFSIDSEKYTGTWRKVMDGLNRIAIAVDKPIVEIRDTMRLLASGQFTEVSVTGEYRGDFLAMRESVNKMIETINSYFGEVAEMLSAISDGDLTKSIKREYIGEFDSLKTPINNMFQTLHRTMTEISSASEQVLIGANQISTSAIDMASGAQKQASSLEELNNTIEIISLQTKQNADSAAIANGLSVKSSGNAQEGNEAMAKMVEAMSKIKESSGNISKIVKTIQDIAFQTNLLALNASVEAARAGEHGRGFSVVADEVRTLAGRSQQAAVETTELIDDSINRVESGSSIAMTTSESLSSIVASADEVLAIISSISAASKEQAEAITDVSDGLMQISQVVQSNSAVSEETAAASEELNSQAEVLRQLVAYFKL